MAGAQAIGRRSVGAATTPARLVSGGFEVAFLDEVVERRMSLSDARAVRFEGVRPVRRFPSFRGQRNNTGLWWSTTMGSHVGFESWLERDQLMLLDFDSAVTAIASQPFWLSWSVGDARRSHAPDYFVRAADGAGVVIDCRPADRIGARDQAAFDATAVACEEVGWRYRLVGAEDPVVVGNVRWLAGYRHPRHHDIGNATRLVEAFSSPAPLIDGARCAGDPIAVLPVAYHLMWTHVLCVDLSAPLNERSDVRLGGDGS